MNAPTKPGPWVDLALTLPVFVAYHLGVVFLRVRNGTDLVTGALMHVAEGSRLLYLLLTAAIGLVFAGVFMWLGRGQTFRPGKFVQIAFEGAIYAFLMRLCGAYVVTKLFLAVAGGTVERDRFAGAIMSLGAGFYEEMTFRVLLFGLGAKLVVRLFAGQPLALTTGQLAFSLRGFLVTLGWSVVAAIVFSGVHYLGPLGDPFDLASFTFRFVLGLVLTAIYALRGFAAAVWSHALYDLWVLVI